METPVNTIYFDLGKVLFDFDFDNLFAHVPATLERDPSLIETTGTLARQLERGAIGAEAFFARLVEYFPEFKTPGHARAAWCDVFRPIEENIAIVHKLYAGQRFGLGVISNTNAPHMAQLHSLSNVFDCFDHLSLSHEVGCMKPDPAIYEHALRGLGACARHSLFFDDREENVRAAEQLGFQAVHVTEAGIVHDELFIRQLID